MSDRVPRIGRLERFDPTMEVVGVGRVKAPTGNALESEVEILLAERRDGGFEIGSAATVWVGCGQFDLLTVRSRWLKGEREPQPQPSGQSATVEFVRDEALGAPLVERGGYRYVPTEGIARAPCFGLRLSALEGFKAGAQAPGFAVVPKIELSRALFGVNSRFLLEMFDGIRNGLVASDRGFFERSKSSAQGRTVRISCPKRLRRNEALIVAAYLSDPKVRAFYDVFFQSLQVDRDFIAHRPAFADPPFPFSGASRWRFEGRWLMRQAPGAPSPRHKVFLITRILGVVFDLHFDRIELVYDVATTVGVGSPPPSTRRMSVVRPRRPRLTTGRAPAGGQNVNEVVTGGTTVLDGVEVEIVTIRVPVVVPPSSGPVGQDAREGRDFSTAGREAGGDPDVGAMVLRRSRSASAQEIETQAREIAAALKLTEDALFEAARQRGWDLRFVVAAAEDGSTRRGERRVDDEILQVEIEADLGFVTVVDVGSLPHDERSLGILRHEHGSNLTQEEDERIRRYTRENGGHWLQRRTRKGRSGFTRKPLEGFHVRAVRRPPGVWSDPAAYARLLAARVDEVLGARA